LAPDGLTLPSSFQIAPKNAIKNHWSATIKQKDLRQKHKIKTTMIMDDGSETPDQCHLAGVMLPPPLCTILCDYQQRIRWLIRLSKKNNTSASSSSKLLEKPDETTIADCHYSIASSQDLTHMLEP
jgi:hypothetical protein